MNGHIAYTSNFLFARQGNVFNLSLRERERERERAERERKREREGGGGGGRERERKGEKTFSLAASFSLLSHLFVAKENLYLYLYL